MTRLKYDNKHLNDNEIDNDNKNNNNNRNKTNSARICNMIVLWKSDMHKNITQCNIYKHVDNIS